MIPKENICFLIITYNAEKYLDKLFNSIDDKYDIFVVDNGSTDGTIKILEENKVKYFANEKNGYAAGINKGLKIIREFGFHFVFVLNQDTEIIEFNPDYSLFEKYAVVQPLILNEDMTIGVDELKMNIYGFVYPYRYKEIPENKSKEITFFSGAAFIINTSKFIKIGDFDERYFMYYEDIDYSVKCFLSNDKIFLNNNIKIIHFYKNSVSSHNKIKLLLKNRSIFLNKYIISIWRTFLIIFKKSKLNNEVNIKNKILFSKFIIEKVLLGFKTKQIPLPVRLIINIFIIPYGFLLRTIVKIYLQ